MRATRPLGALLPRRLEAAHDAPIRALLAHADVRVAEDSTWRLLTGREGEVAERLLAVALRHPGEKVRHLAAGALGDMATEGSRAALRARRAEEQDPRLLLDLAVALAKAGEEVDVATLPAWEGDPVLADLARARVLAASKREGALGDLLDWLDASSPGGPHAIVWMEAAELLKARVDPAVTEWAGWMLAQGGRMDPYVLAAVVELVGEQGLLEHAGALAELAGGAARAAPVPDVATALAKALAALAAKEGADAAALDAALRSLATHPSAFARAAAREAMAGRGLSVPADDAPPNDWRGLPRPKDPVLGVSLPGDDPWLTATEILRLADAIAREDPHIVFQTTAGPFAIALEPADAPVHCVNVVLAALAGAYDGTRWHRVVPAFVIQGGDPHGHGGGGGGWTVPDELSPLPFARGAVGMPKGTKDDGGCQLFVMHLDYTPLDERYTRFGRVVEGQDTVDKIRIGDLILGARLVVR
jgi:cyclophilin family peptidyl-prolyl cis-trans isomerase